MPALRATVERIAQIDFPDQKSVHADLQRMLTTITALQTESWDAIAKPKSARRETLGKDYATEASHLIDSLDRLGQRLFASIKHSDPAIDELLQVKEVAWAVRNTAGEASVMISTGLGAGHVAPDARQVYAENNAGARATWGVLQNMAAATVLPARVTEAIATANRTFFSADYEALRLRMIEGLIKEEKSEMTANQWVPIAVERLASILAIAEAAL